ncbi:putative Glycosyltransferase [Vibrio coralliirubri]|uniref:glycosyltransferase n=1 Tax=Vibrio coralliirubri TaxID=1516159 RepID=UPI000630D9ED|nr:glycosyltransferase [Vibrio coralliirubri]CDT93288.1 putative Glycosyltransferase [Vibrio coralliirubri]
MKGKTILFVTSYPINEEPVIRNRLIPYIEQALEYGSHVTLLSTDSIESQYLIDKGVQHVLVKDEKRKPSGMISRAIFEHAQAKAILKTVRKLEFSACIVTIPSMFLLFSAFKLNNRAMYLDVRDITWEYLSNKNFIIRFVKFGLKWLARNKVQLFNRVAVTNSTEELYLKELINKTSPSIHVVSNGVSSQQYSELVSIPVKNKRDSVVSYIGNVGLAQNLKLIVDVAESLPDVKFNIVGDGTDFESVKSYVAEKKVANVNLTGRVTWQEVLGYYYESDILYAQLTKEFSGAMPSKLYEYLCVGRYIIYGGEKQAESILSQFSNCIIIEPDDKEQLSKSIADYFNNQVVNDSCYLDNRIKIKDKYIREDNIARFLSLVERDL